MRSATFTMTFYLVYMILVFAIVLEILFLKDYQQLDLLRLKEFDSKLEYNQCQTNFLVNGTNYNKDITENNEIKIFHLEMFILFSLIGALITPILEVILVCLPPPIPMLNFMLGPSYATDVIEEANRIETVTK